MNINMLRDEDNDPGFYAAACATDQTQSWPGAVLYESKDGGSNYSAKLAFEAEATMGVTTNALGNFTGGNVVDESNKLNVRLTHGSLSSTTYLGLLAGTNACVVGDEIIYFRDATLEGDGTYTLKGLLRGRRGSENEMTVHAVGERFVFLSVANIKRVAAVTADIGKTYHYKPVTAGRSVTATTAQQFTNEGTGLKPYSPVLLGGGRNAAGDLTITWVRRGRTSGEWRDSVDVPLGEATEEYVVEIYNSTYTTLKRTITGLTSQQASYSAADQTTDFGGTQSTVYFKVYQLSATVGRGYAATGSV